MKTRLVIFGITGDLSRRKLLPALRKIIASGAVKDLEIIGISRGKVDLEELVGDELKSYVKIITMDLTSEKDYQTLKTKILPKKNQQTLIYLSVPPLAATRITDYLGGAGINTDGVKLMFEKPFGLDYESAKDMVERTARYFHEEQIYRIDHYMAKEMVQNIIAFRSGNAIFRHLWGSRGIERVEVRAYEEIGISGRAQFYEQTGALRDVLQGHLVQLLALVLMDVPSKLDWSAVPDLRLQALKRILTADPSRAARAQYNGYRHEVGVSNSQVETFVQVCLESDASNWENVPISLSTGKGLDRKETEIAIYFRAGSTDQTNSLKFKIQPDEGIEIALYTKKPGYERVMESQKLSFSYSADETLPEAYEQVLVDAINSRKSLFTTSQEIIESWRILQPVLSAWALDDEDIQKYEVGASAEDILSSSQKGQ